MIDSRTSRYAGTETAVQYEADGSQIPYLRRRMVPQSGSLGELRQVQPPGAGMRLDLVAARYLGDPEQFWRLLDANDGLDPFDFLDETQGRPLRIPRTSAAPA